MNLRSFAIPLLLVVAPHSVQAQPGDLAVSAAETRTRELQRIAEIPGISVAVGNREGLVWSETFGFANLETPAVVTDDTRFRAASVSKVITVAALARLADAGTIDLDAPIETWLPDLSGPVRHVTLRELAAHLAGIRHYERKDFGPAGPDNQQFETLEEALSIFIDDPLVADPSTRYHYSTYGYTVLGAVIEKASGTSFLSLVEEEVFQPLGMRDSSGDIPQRIVPGRAGFYSRVQGGELVHSNPVNASYKWPGGGLLTSPEDLVRFGVAHLSPGYFSEEMLRAMFTPMTLLGGESTGVGLGWRIGRDWRGRKIYHHSGSMSGARSSILLYPEVGFVAAIMTNLTTTPYLVESTLQMIVEPFLKDSELEDVHVPAGEFSYEGYAHTPDRDIPITGWMTIIDGGASVSGLISLPLPLVEMLLSQNFPLTEALPIVGWTSHETASGAIVATPLGLVYAPVEMSPAGITLTIDAGAVTLELNARRSGQIRSQEEK